MKRFFRTFPLTLAVAVTAVITTLVAAEKSVSLRKYIVEERIRNEILDIERRIATARNEHTASARKYLVSLTAYKKLQLLRRSALYHHNKCFWFDNECRRLYAMTIVYLDTELTSREERRTTEREEALNAAASHLALVQRKELLRSAKIPEEEHPSYEIAEIRGMFRCVDVEGWNRLRGVFVEADNPFDLPFAVEIVAAAQEGSTAFIAVSFREAYIIYSYIGEPLFSAGDIVPPYTRLFERPTDNPVVPGTVLVTLLYKGLFVNPSFMCR